MHMPEIRVMRLADLKDAPYNPRRISNVALNALHKNMSKFGYLEPIIWNERTGLVVGGHQRKKVLVAEAVEECPVIVIDVDETEEKALNIALNNPHMMGEFTDNLQELLDEISTKNGKLFEDILGARLKRGQLGKKPDLDVIPPAPAETITKPGTVWTLGRHRLACGDATNQAIVAQLMGRDRSVAAITDPPYSVDYSISFSKRERGLDAGAQTNYQESNDPGALIESALTMAPDLVVMTYPIDRHFFRLAEALDHAGFESVRELVWVKDAPSFHPGQTYQQMHEPILVLRRAGTRYPDSVPKDAKTVISVPRVKLHDDHPTAKPIDLWTQLVEWHTEPEDLVYEPFGGSGTTLIACEVTGRRCNAVEIMPAFCDVIVARWETVTGQKAQRS